ncbi:Uncharacterised protein [Mycobacteroides abscessus subsp. abscessus]|nr:Uncharacterised protein [Mycobacteroides abscessus subsp. abscessus]
MAICTCSLLCLDCRSARTAAACSAAVLASDADLAESASAFVAESEALWKLAICAAISPAITRWTESWSIRPCGESAVRMASMPSVRPPMYCAAAILSTESW